MLLGRRVEALVQAGELGLARDQLQTVAVHERPDTCRAERDTESKRDKTHRHHLFHSANA